MCFDASPGPSGLAVSTGHLGAAKPEIHKMQEVAPATPHTQPCVLGGGCRNCPPTCGLLASRQAGGQLAAGQRGPWAARKPSKAALRPQVPPPSVPSGLGASCAFLTPSALCTPSAALNLDRRLGQIAEKCP